MNIRTLLSSVSSLQSQTSSATSSVTSPATSLATNPATSPVATTAAVEPSVLMTCEVCDLVGGPFSAAEAAHLRAIHDRLHHGIMAAA